MVFSPDTKLVLVAGYDGNVLIGDTVTGRILRIFKAHDTSIYSIALSPDGKTFATGEKGINIVEKALIKLWVLDQVLAGNDKFVALTGYGDIHNLVFSPDSKILASTDSEGNIKLWEASSGKKLPWAGNFSNRLSTIIFSSDSKYLITGHDGLFDNNAMIIWEVATGKSILTLSNDDAGRVQSLAFSPDGKLLLSNGYSTSSQSQVIKLWEFSAGKVKETASITAFIPYLIMRTPFSLDGKFLVSTISNKKIQLWDIENKKLLFSTTEQQTFELSSVTVSPDFKRLVSGHADGSIKLWDIVGG